MAKRGDNSEEYCQGLEEYDALVRRLKDGDKLLDVPLKKRALAMGLWTARRGRKKGGRHDRRNVE